MQFTHLVIRSFSIVERKDIQTDSLDPEYLEASRETLAEAHSTLSPLRIGGSEDDPVYLELGWPEGMNGIRAVPGAQQVINHFFSDMPETTGTVFQLLYEGSGPVYVVIPSEQQDDEVPENSKEDASSIDNMMDGMHASFPELSEKMDRFDRMWDEVMDSLPVVLRFGTGDWGEEWEEFAIYLAAAILLDDAESGMH